MSFLACTLALLSFAPQTGGQEQPSTLTELTRAGSWTELVTRDQRLSFGMLTRGSAITALARPGVTDERKAAALMALGCAHVAGERPRLESWAQEGKSELRQAAILALGELRSGDAGVLIELTNKRSEAVAESALLALARSGSAAGLAHVRQIAADANNPLASKAAAILAFIADPAGTPDLAVARTLYDLRFAAARAHGLVDGQAWDVLVLDALCEDQKFLNRVIYRAASELKNPGIRDHFFEIALEKGPPERLRGVVNAIPAELSQMIESGDFVPVDERDWTALLTEIDARRLEGFTDPILRRAFLVPGLRGWTSVLLARGGSSGANQLLEVGLESDDATERAMCAVGLGATGSDQYLTTLSAIEQDESPEVRAAALVGQVRLGSEKALKKVRDLLGVDRPEGEKTKPDTQWAALVDALSRAAGDMHVREALVDVLPRLPVTAKAKVAAALLEVGVTDMRSTLRDYLRAERPGGTFGARCVAALAGGAPGLEDLAVMRELFPVEDDLELDVELAYSLLRLKDPEILPMLRASLWAEPLNRSVLTGALWIEAAGLDSFRIEVLHPPVGASPRDQRRAGLALGEWGGIEQVDWLAERLNAGDPALQGAVLGALGARTH